ncbi:hypothetical protein HispidOSU_020439, partial [Sigmodon hispidus]
RSGEEEICFSAHWSDQVQLATRAATRTPALSASREYAHPVRSDHSAGPSRQGSRVTSLLKILALWSLSSQSFYHCVCGSLERASWEERRT